VSVVLANLPPPAEPLAFDHVGPVRVAHESRAMLATLAASTLGVIFVLSVIIVLCALRIRRLRDR
jgi:hypothetical protein